MTNDRVVDEIHRIRTEMLAEHGGNLNALVKELQRLTDQSAAAGRSGVGMPPRILSSAATEKKLRGKRARKIA
jgi:hypothetical protein